MLSLDSEVRLYNTSSDRERYTLLSSLFAIITSLEYLERAFVADAVTADEYSAACSRLIAQYNTAKNIVPSVEDFMLTYRLDTPAALHRLKTGVPATVEHHGGPGRKGSEKSDVVKRVAETTQHFITFMDALKLNLRAKDQLYPLLQDLVTSYSRFSSQDEGRSALVSWLILLNGMNASKEISQSQARELSFDVDSAYSAFFKSLGR